MMWVCCIAPAANASINSGVSTALMLNSALTVSVSCFLDADLDLMFPSLDEAALLASVLFNSGARISGLSARKDSCQSAGPLNHKHGREVDTASTLLHAGQHTCEGYLPDTMDSAA